VISPDDLAVLEGLTIPQLPKNALQQVVGCLAMAGQEVKARETMGILKGYHEKNAIYRYIFIVDLAIKLVIYPFWDTHSGCCLVVTGTMEFDETFHKKLGIS